MTKLLPLLLLLLWASLVTVGVSAQDPANDLLADIHQRLDELRPLRIAFDQTQVLHDLDFTLRSSGEMVLAVDDTLSWRQLDPIQTEHTITDNGIEDQGGDGLTGAAGRLVSEVVRAILLADQGSSSACSSFTSPVDRQYPWRLELTPKQKWIAVALDRVALHGRMWVDHVDIHYSGGDHVTLALQPPQSLAETTRRGSGQRAESL